MNISNTNIKSGRYHFSYNPENLIPTINGVAPPNIIGRFNGYNESNWFKIFYMERGKFFNNFVPNYLDIKLKFWAATNKITANSRVGIIKCDTFMNDIPFSSQNNWTIFNQDVGPDGDYVEASVMSDYNTGTVTIYIQISTQESLPYMGGYLDYVAY